MISTQTNKDPVQKHIYISLADKFQCLESNWDHAIIFWKGIFLAFYSEMPFGKWLSASVFDSPLLLLRAAQVFLCFGQKFHRFFGLIVNTNLILWLALKYGFNGLFGTVRNRVCSVFFLQSTNKNKNTWYFSSGTHCIKKLSQLNECITKLNENWTNAKFGHWMLRTCRYIII